jgi:ATP-dependent protease Clp ATPase subunit
MRMLRRTRLACSICGRGAAEVSKLVAGPRVFICDRCVAEANRIMNTAPVPTTPATRRSLVSRLVQRLRKPQTPLQCAHL